MIERLLAAERALAEGRLEQAERLFRQVAEADERNAIAVVGLAEVALARGDRSGAEALASRALAIDPDDVAASRLIAGSTPGGIAVTAPGPAGSTVDETDVAAPGVVEPAAGPEVRRGLVARLRAWLGRALGHAA